MRNTRSSRLISSSNPWLIASRTAIWFFQVAIQPVATGEEERRCKKKDRSLHHILVQKKKREAGRNKSPEDVDIPTRRRDRAPFLNYIQQKIGLNYRHSVLRNKSVSCKASNGDAVGVSPHSLARPSARLALALVDSIYSTVRAVEA